MYRGAGLDRIQRRQLGTGMSTAFIVLALMCAIIALLPSKFDPAIRLKEWLQRKK
jgi:hypothetical protein